MGKIRVAFTFDMTGSQAPVYAELRRKLTETFSSLFASIKGLEIAQIAHGDYCDAHTSYVTKMLDFCDKLQDHAHFAMTVSPTHGGDGDECYEYVMREARNLSWGDADRKILVMIGDADPHGSRYVWGGKEYLIDWREQARYLNSIGITIYAVQCQRHSMTNWWKELARMGQGKWLDLTHFTDIVPLIQAICYKEQGDDELAQFVGRLGTINSALARTLNELAGKNLAKIETSGHEDWAVPGHRFQVLHVDYPTAIREFVEDTGVRYVKGRGFYQWTKTETIQMYKEIVVRNKRTGDFFAGDKARELVGLPIGSDARLRPAVLGEYDIFVQSTSVNRKLLPNTLFLYEAE